MKMGHQEPTGSSSNRNGRQAKKPKPKKVPQRGMGVAQLEKIRLEEEVKNDTANLQSLAVTPLPFPRHYTQYPFLNDDPYGHVSCTPHLNMRHHGTTVSATLPNNAEAGNSLLSSNYIQEVDKSTRFSGDPKYEPTMLMSPFGVVLLGTQQPSSFSSLMMNDAAENSSSAVLNSQTEPPSNQSPYVAYRSVQPDEANKMVGTKRTCSFSTQDPSNTFLRRKANSFSVQSSSGSLVVKGNSSFRDCMPQSISTSNSSDGDFLKLALPVTVSLFPSSKSKEAQYCPQTHQAELLKHNSKRPKVLYPLDTHSQSQAQQHSFHTFLPEHNITEDDQSRVMARHRSEDEECLDLSLKL